MNIFEEVKSKVKITDVCSLLGIKLDRHYKALCPFHKEKTASFSVHPDKNIFCCFSCDKKGDAITLVSELLKISPLEAVKYLNESLHLGVVIDGKKPDMSKVNLYTQKREARKRFEEWENQTFQFLCDFYKKLERDSKEFTPSYECIYALKNRDFVGYLIDDIFINGTEEAKIWFKKNYGKKVEEWKTIMKNV